MQHFPVQVQENKKNLTWKKFLTFPQIEFSSFNVKKFLDFLKRMFFLYFLKWNPAIFIPSPKNKKNPPQEKFLIFYETET